MIQEPELRQLEHLFIGKWSDFLIQDINVYIDHAENPLALEILCDALSDYALVLSAF